MPTIERACKPSNFTNFPSTHEYSAYYAVNCSFLIFSCSVSLQTLVMGNRDVIDEMSNTNSSVLVSIIKLIDKYDLYGQVAYPKHHKQSDVREIYRLAAKSKVEQQIT